MFFDTNNKRDMDRKERNQLLLNVAYAIIDLVEDNQILEKECKDLTEYKKKNEETNRSIRKNQMESIGFVLKHYADSVG